MLDKSILLKKSHRLGKNRQDNTIRFNNINLFKAENGFFLPSYFAQFVNCEKVENAVCTGGRSAKVGLEDDFFVDVKGVGRHVKDVRINLNLINYDFDFEKDVLFSRNKYTTKTGFIDNSPEGGMTSEEAEKELEISKKLEELTKDMKYPLKFAKITEIIQMPLEISDKLNKFNRDNIVTSHLCQVKRLMPSYVRMSFFNFEDNNPSNLFEKTNIEKKGIYDSFLSFIESLEKTTKNNNGFYWEWTQLMDKANITQIFNKYNIQGKRKAEKYLKKNYSWYAAKDLVVSKDGLYFVDMSSVKELSDNFDGMKKLQSLYLSQVFKDFGIFLGQFYANKGNYKDKKEILEEMSDVVNNSGLNVKVEFNEEIKVKMPYADIKIPYEWVIVK